MDITHDAPNRRFTVQLEGGSGELQYEELPGGVIEFHHTWVDPPIRKRGTAAELVRAGVAWARAQGAKVEPTCPYVRSWFDRNPAEQDLLA
jgi:predicted GNAT family acetyltransferase